jgi:hypothetical protein
VIIGRGRLVPRKGSPRTVFGNNGKGRGRLISLVDNAKGDILVRGIGRLIPQKRSLRTVL